MSEKIYFCPTCGLGFKNMTGAEKFYCPDCGETVTTKNDANTSFSKQLLDAAPEVLFKRSHKGEVNAALLIEAANRGSVDAMLELGATYMIQNNYDEALPMLKKASDLGDAYATCLYAMTKSRYNAEKNDFSYDELDEIIEMLKKVPGCIEQWTTLYNFLYKFKEEHDKEEEERRRSSYSTSSYSSYDTSSYSSYSYPPTPQRESTIWSDWRTGEPLYREGDKIVNGAGEEVSVAWWD